MSLPPLIAPVSQVFACSTTLADRRRKFWSTQPDVCGTEDDCGYTCGNPGLAIFAPDPPPGEDDVTKIPRTIATNDYVRGLILNILLTSARKPDIPCGYRAGAIGGFWGDSYRTDGQYSGTMIRYIPTTGSIRDAVSLIRAYAEKDMKKLITYGVATDVTVEATYAGGATVNLDIRVFGRSGDETRVGITAARMANSWVWK